MFTNLLKCSVKGSGSPTYCSVVLCVPPSELWARKGLRAPVVQADWRVLTYLICLLLPKYPINWWSLDMGLTMRPSWSVFRVLTYHWPASVDEDDLSLSDGNFVLFAGCIATLSRYESLLLPQGCNILGATTSSVAVELWVLSANLFCSMRHHSDFVHTSSYMAHLQFISNLLLRPLLSSRSSRLRASDAPCAMSSSVCAASDSFLNLLLPLCLLPSSFLGPWANIGLVSDECAGDLLTARLSPCPVPLPAASCTFIR